MLKPFSEDISTGTFFDPGDIQDDPTTEIAVPVVAKSAFKYKGPIKKPDEITPNDLKKVYDPTEKISLYLQMVGANPKHRRGRWIMSQRDRLWDDTKLLQHHGYGADAYNKKLLDFIRKQDDRWLIFEKNRKAGISIDSVIQGLMKDLGITKWKASILLSYLSDPKKADKLSKKEKEVMKKYNAGDAIRAAGRKPIAGFGEFYHRDVGWYS